MYSLGLLGYPVLQSLSPLLHTAALRMMSLAGEYRLYPAPPGPDVAQGIAILMDRMRSGELHGLNVTIPHKQTVIPYLDEMTPVASAIGAVNTIYTEDGRSWGDNTDSPGFMIDLGRVAGGLVWGLPATSHREFRVLDEKPEEYRRIALLLGAGGAARAVCFALIQAGWRVVVAARRLEQAQKLVDDLAHSQSVDGETGGDEAPSPPPVNALTGALPLLEPVLLTAPLVESLNPAPVLIVNTIPQESSAGVEDCAWPPGANFPAGAFLYDLAYLPAETLMMRQASVAGLQTANGLGMLIEQAALSLERWTGKPVPRRAMWQAIPESYGVCEAIHYASSPQRGLK